MAHYYSPLIFSIVGDAGGRDVPTSERTARQMRFASLQVSLCNVSVLQSVEINDGDGSVKTKYTK